jgi:8-oxo-dGTP pyrophosphatase MutT (NUDIX family)
VITTDVARVVLERAGWELATLVAIPGGWASWTFEVDGARIVQFPRDADVAAGHARARQLLPELAVHLTFSVPVPRVLTDHQGLAVQYYERIRGEPLRAEAFDARVVGAMLRDLHSFPAERARVLLDDPGTVESWRAGYEAIWPDIEARVLPLVPEGLAAQLTDEYRSTLSDAAFKPCLVHRDLGLEHLLVGETPGMIDFEDVAVGDPAIDFAGIFNACGLTTARETMHHYGPVDADFGARLRFYRWMGSVHAAIHALNTGDADLLDGALREIALRLETRPRTCAAVVRDGYVLMVCHRDAFWTLPGGGREPGENEQAATLRELHEETGLDGVVVRELYRRTYGAGPEVCYLVESHGEPRRTQDPDISDVAWHPLDTPDDLQLARVRRALRADDKPGSVEAHRPGAA